MNDSASNRAITYGTDRPFVQRYFTWIFLLVAVCMFGIAGWLAEGLAFIPIAVLFMPLTILYGVIMGHFVRRRYNRKGYVFSAAAKFMVFALAVSMIVCSVIFSLTTTLWGPLSLGLMFSLMLITVGVLAGDATSNDRKK